MQPQQPSLAPPLPPTPSPAGASASDQLKQVVERLNTSNNVLVTVSANPSVDQLAACIGLTVALNKMGKHATAVFSGKIPSTIEFLEPEKTLEKNTDSLRDFIIALDKSKADKLRYKVDNENQVVKIFITPYRTSLSEKDLEFSQGDFNIDSVVALGVHDKADLDAAIVAHGRILHDATVMAIGTGSASSELGSIHWLNGAASSLCEMSSDLISDLQKDVLDVQIATSLLTGIVAETARFSNEKATPHTMSVSGLLMSAGANQQLVASKLDEKPQEEEKPEPIEEEKEEIEVTEDSEKPEDGTIQIDHEEELPEVEEDKKDDEDEGAEEIPEGERDDIHIDNQGKLLQLQDGKMPEVEEDEKPPQIKPSSMILEPPSMGGQLTASGQTDILGGAVNPLDPSQAEAPKILGRDAPLGVGPAAPPLMPPSMSAAPPASGGQTLSDLENQVGRTAPPLMPTGLETPAPQLNDARDKVEQIINTAGDGRPQPPLQSIGSTPVDLNLAPSVPAPVSTSPMAPPANNMNPGGPPPPPVPPPMMPPAI